MKPLLAAFSQSVFAQSRRPNFKVDEEQLAAASALVVGIEASSIPEGISSPAQLDAIQATILEVVKDQGGESSIPELQVETGLSHDVLNFAVQSLTAQKRMRHQDAVLSLA